MNLTEIFTKEQARREFHRRVRKIVDEAIKGGSTAVSIHFFAPLIDPETGIKTTLDAIFHCCDDEPA